MTFLVGGARSGKSRLSLELGALLDAPVCFVATAEGRDEEMADRIARHKRQRPKDWTTIEEPLELLGVLEAIAERDGVIIDCLTLWVANLLGRGDDDQAVLESAQVLAGYGAKRAGGTIVVSNEVGSGIVPMESISRRFRDLLGEVNAIFAAAAEHSYFVVAGKTLELSSPPGAGGARS